MSMPFCLSTPVVSQHRTGPPAGHGTACRRQCVTAAIRQADIFNWLQAECGATAGPYQLRVGPVGPSGNYRGVISHDYIPAGSNIFQVPLEATLVARSPIAEDEDAHRQLWLSTGLPALAVRLLRVCHSGLLPRLQPWTKLLPEVSPMLIHRLRADRIRQLCSPYLADQAEAYLEAQQAGLQAHAAELGSLGLIPRDFEWAYGVAHSRVGGWTDSTARFDVVIPGIDMVNHDRNCTAQIRPYPDMGSGVLSEALELRSKDEGCASGAGICLVAKRNIMPGEEISIYYGNFTASEFLLDYGFIPPETQHTAGQDHQRALLTLQQLEPLCT